MLTQAVAPEASSRETVAPHAANGAAAAQRPVANFLRLMGAGLPFARNVEIYGEKEPADYLYCVMRGAARTYRVLHDGRRQIAGFYLPGDMFGLELGEIHTTSAEAISDSIILVVKRRSLVSLASRDAGVAQQLWALTARELERAQAHLTLLVRTAEERIAAFLLEMAERGAAGDALDLPMPRQDIADYLGLTIETVSRTLTQLEQQAAIELPSSRRIVLRNRSVLKRLNR
jgi:CRP/FNR family transcriptional regulator, nitrogen fixation regulation protein